MEGAVAVDLKSLFSGQQFSFLPEEDRERHVEVPSSPHTIEATGQQEDPKTLFFFHWSTPSLSNREETLFTSQKTREELERGWSEQRAAMKSMLRKSHRQASHRHKQTPVKFMSYTKT